MVSKDEDLQAGPEIPIYEPADENTTPLWLAKYSLIISNLLFCNCLIIATLTLAGWIFDSPVMYALVPGLATMKFNTALSFFLLGLSGIGYLYLPKSKYVVILWALAVVFLISALTLLQYAFSINIGIDQLIVRDVNTLPELHPGRMSQASAAGLMLSSIACAGLCFNKVKLAQVSSLVVFITGLLALTAYLFDREAIESFLPFSSLAVNTAVAFSSYGLAILFAESKKAYLRFLYYDSNGGKLAQKFSPIALLIPFVVAGAVNYAGRIFGFSAEFGLFLMSSVVALVFFYLLSRMSRFVHELELEANRAELRQRLSSERIAQIKRIESMGLVAGGVAHDFRNLLMPIIWSADLGLNALTQNPENSKRFEIIRDSAHKASALAEKMMSLGKKKALHFDYVNLNALLEELKGILHSMSRGKVEVVYQLTEQLDEIVADKSQIEQILINLTRNACQAMNDSGRLVIATSQCCLDRDEMNILSSANIENGEYVCMSITDEGVGMTEEQRQHVLEPFYSTKDAGTGHGLGLSNVNDIVLQHLGILDILSTPGKGTTVLVYFPAKVRTKKSVMASSDTLPKANGRNGFSPLLDTHGSNGSPVTNGDLHPEHRAYTKARLAAQPLGQSRD